MKTISHVELWKCEIGEQFEIARHGVSGAGAWEDDDDTMSTMSSSAPHYSGNEDEARVLPRLDVRHRPKSAKKRRKMDAPDGSVVQVEGSPLQINHATSF